MPDLTDKIWNLANSIAAFVADGCQTVRHAEYAERLAICDRCGEREQTVCRKCGCYLPIKAQGRVMECPLGKWKRPVSPIGSLE